MSTLNELISHRETAGARYVTAVAELRAAYGDLAAIERLLENKKYQHPVASFGGPQPDPIALRHPIYLSTVGGQFEDDIRAAYAERDRRFGTPDPVN